ncbi:MAG: SDR family oxidoreductase [Terriglobia bacterium]
MKKNDKPILLVIGGHGFIGEHLARVAASNWDVWTAGRSSNPAANKSVELDVRNARRVRAAFDLARPDVVVLLAAVSDIDRCEREPDLARAVNVQGSRNVANECARTGARLVYTSSSAVFDGMKHGYREDDPPSPLSVYGRTKLDAERNVAAAVPSAIILRPALVLGLSSRNDTNALLNRWVALWKAGKSVAALPNEYRNPVDAGALAAVILDLGLNRNAAGVYHVGAADSMSRYEIACWTAEALGCPAGSVIPEIEGSSARAPRGRDHFLITDRIRHTCAVPLGTAREAIWRSLGEITEGSLRAGI